jgi:hypothetical protein
MGQQSNKVQKRRRRLDYLARIKAKAKAVVAAKPVKKKPAAKKEKAAVTPRAAAAVIEQSAPTPLTEPPAPGQVE